MYEHKIAYNIESSRKWGWTPDWFGAACFDNYLIESVENWQRAAGLEDDGLVGTQTYRRIVTEREVNADLYEPYGPVTETGGAHLFFNGHFVPIDWNKVVLFSDPDGFKAPNGTYTSFAGKEQRQIDMGVTHWDVCLSSQSCFKVLVKRGISVHFLIDNDGTIYQTLDMQHAGWHAGSRVCNLNSVGVEISNAYYLKYQGWYEKHGFGPRQVVKGAKVHGGTLEDHLGFYPVQAAALRALWRAVGNACSIPFDTPGHLDGVCEPAAKGHYRGFVHHYNLTRRKIDCGGFDMADIIEGLMLEKHTEDGE
jgi:hypothetical protein